MFIFIAMIGMKNRKNYIITRIKISEKIITYNEIEKAHNFKNSQEKKKLVQNIKKSIKIFVYISNILFKPSAINQALIINKKIVILVLDFFFKFYQSLK